MMNDSEKLFVLDITSLPQKCRWRVRSDCWRKKRKKENVWRLFLKKGKNEEKFNLWEFRFTNFQRSSCLAKLNQVCTEFGSVVNEACFPYWHPATAKPNWTLKPSSNRVFQQFEHHTTWLHTVGPVALIQWDSRHSSAPQRSSAAHRFSLKSA